MLLHGGIIVKSSRKFIILLYLNAAQSSTITVLGLENYEFRLKWILLRIKDKEKRYSTYC